MPPSYGNPFNVDNFVIEVTWYCESNYCLFYNEEKADYLIKYEDYSTHNQMRDRLDR